MRAPAPITAGPRTTEPLDRGARLDHDPALDPRVLVDLAVEPCLDLLQHQPVGLEHVGELAGVLPPAADHLRAGRVRPSSISFWIASVISSSPRQEGSSARAASKIGGVKR